jgi:hypothetical protein
MRVAQLATDIMLVLELDAAESRRWSEHVERYIETGEPCQ